MSRVIPECDNGEADDLRHEDRMAGQVSQKLNEHPDCRDPDHPGCDQCDDGLEVEECEECGQILDECWCEDFNEIEETGEDD